MSEINQRMSPAELREACVCAAATAVVSLRARLRVRGHRGS